MIIPRNTTILHNTMSCVLLSYRRRTNGATTTQRNGFISFVLSVDASGTAYLTHNGQSASKSVHTVAVFIPTHDERLKRRRSYRVS